MVALLEHTCRQQIADCDWPHQDYKKNPHVGSISWLLLAAAKVHGPRSTCKPIRTRPRSFWSGTHETTLPKTTVRTSKSLVAQSKKNSKFGSILIQALAIIVSWWSIHFGIRSQHTPTDTMPDSRSKKSLSKQRMSDAFKVLVNKSGMLQQHHKWRCYPTNEDGDKEEGA